MKNVVQDLTSAGIDWQREKWQSGLGSKFIHQGEKAWEGSKDSIFDSNNEDLNNLVFASNLFKKVKQYHKL